MPWTRVLYVFVVIAALVGPARGQPAPLSPVVLAKGDQPLSLLDVPFISQSEALCGGAAAAMVLRYWGARGVDAESFAHLVDRSAAGIRATVLLDELRRRGWNAVGLTGSPVALTRELARGRPVVTLIEDRPGVFHYVVVVASTDRVLIFHDPARAPLRVMRLDEFRRRWAAAASWMAIVLPAKESETTLMVQPPPPVPGPPSPDGSRSLCDALVSEGIAYAQANDLSSAERALTRALSCPGAAPLRELAGVRLLQRQWSDVSELASSAIAIDPRDEHSWRLLATSRFVQDDRAGALSAWNRVGEPRIDLVAISGLVRTRQRQVERLMGATRGDVLTPSDFIRARRRVSELPSALSTRVEYVPVQSGLAELRVAVNERPVVPSDIWSLAGVGLRAAANREVAVSAASLMNAGERLSAVWRFWSERPSVSVGLESPAPWGGVWGVRGLRSRETFDLTLDRAERTAGELSVTNWVTSTTRLAARGGAARWEHGGVFATLGGEARMLTHGERIQADGRFDIWSGRTTFSRIDARLIARSSTDRTGAVLQGGAGIGMATDATPADIWFAGDTGQARDVLLRAHPVLRGGKLVTALLGRRIVHASVEGRYWWPVAAARLGSAVFVDAASVGRRSDPGVQRNVDVGLGARLAIPGVRGTLRADVARGLRDGVTTVSIVYEPRD